MSTTAPAYSKPTIALALLCGALPGLFLLITSTTYLVPGEFVYDIKRLLQLCIMTALFLAATLNPGLRNAFGMQLARIPTWVKALLGLIVALGITSSIVNATSNMHLAYSLLEVALLSLLVLAALVIAACRVVAGELFDQVAITLLAMTSIAVGIQELLGVAAALANDTEFYFRISLMYYSYPRFFNQVQAWTLPVLAAIPLIWSDAQSDVLRNKALQASTCLLAIGLNWYVVLMTGGRGVAISLGAAFLLCLTVFPALRKPSLRWHLPGFALGFSLFLVVSHVMVSNVQGEATSSPQSTSHERTQGVNPRDHFENIEGQSKFERQSMSGRISLDSSGRWGLWRASMEDFKANPLLGNGPMNFACTGPIYRSAHPHNFPLQVAGEWGGLAFLMLVAVSLYLLRIFWAIRVATEANLRQASLTALLAFGVVAACTYSLLSGVFVMPASQVSGLLVCGWLLAVVGIRSQARPVRSTHSVSTLVAVLLLASATLVFSLDEAGKRGYREDLLPPLDGAIPRYWQHGKLCKYFDRY